MDCFFRQIVLILIPVKKKNNATSAYDADNRTWRADLTQTETKENIDTMKYIGCTSRGQAQRLAWKLFNKTYGKQA